MDIYVVFLCSAFVLAPVKQETLESTISLKEKQQCVKIQIEKKKNYNQEDLQPERKHTVQRIKKQFWTSQFFFTVILINLFGFFLNILCVSILILNLNDSTWKINFKIPSIYRVMVNI